MHHKTREDIGEPLYISENKIQKILRKAKIRKNSLLMALGESKE